MVEADKIADGATVTARHVTRDAVTDQAVQIYTKKRHVSEEFVVREIQNKVRGFIIKRASVLKSDGTCLHRDTVRLSNL